MKREPHHKPGTRGAGRPPPRSALRLALCLALSGCGAGERPQAEATAGPPEALVPPPAARPESVADTLTIEGTPQPTTLRIYRAPPDFPLAFSTYLPADLAAVPATSDDGPAVRFEARFGGRARPAVYLQVVALPPGTSSATARETARWAANELGESAEAPEQGRPWATATFLYQGSDHVVGAVSLGRHAGRFFYVVMHLPAEAADGFGPRAARVMERWRWSDDGTSLEDG